MKNYQQTFTAVLVTAVLVGGAVYFFTSNSTETPSVNSQGEPVARNQTDDFKKNQECLKMKSEIELKLENKNSPFGDASLEQIFFSPKVNSCVYVEYTEKDGFYNKRLLDVRNDGYSSDPLTMCSAVSPLPAVRETYERLDGDLSRYQKDLAGCNNFEEKLAEYK